MDDAGSVLDRQRRLRDEAEGRRIGRIEANHVLLALDQRDRALGKLTHRADDLGMAGMADQEDVAAEPVVAHRLLVDLGDQRTGRVEIEQLAHACVLGNRFGDAVSREHHRAMAVVGGNLVQLLDEDSAAGLEPFDDVAVVDDLVADIDRRAVFLQREHDDLMARSTPAQKPRGWQSLMVSGGFVGRSMVPKWAGGAACQGDR